MSRHLFAMTLLAAALFGFGATSEAKNPFKNTPFDPGTWNPGDWVKPKPPIGSGLAVITDYTEIRQNGEVWRYYSSNSTNGSWSRITKLSPQYDSEGRARFYYSQAGNSPLRVPQYDLQVEYRTVTDTQNRMYRQKIVGGNVVSSTFIGYKQQPVTPNYPTYPNQGNYPNQGSQGNGQQPVPPGVQIAIEIIKALQDD